jgi:chemotaxis protein MotB
MEAENRAKEMQLQLEKANSDCNTAKNNLSNQTRDLQSQLETKNAKAKLLEDQIDMLKITNTELLNNLSKLSMVSQTSAETVNKSLSYIKDLNTSIQKKDSMNLSLVMNIKRSLDNVNDKDITVEVKKGVVYISISDKLLFSSGSANINKAAENVLAKIAKVVNDHKDFDILIEGHTDNVPIKTACFDDNWDLSAKRATSIVRFLQTRHKVAPERMTAGARAEYVPKATNKTEVGRSTNRRTEIIILPKLDQFFQLLEPQKKK